MDQSAEMLLANEHTASTYTAKPTIYDDMLTQFPRIAEAIKGFPEQLQGAAFTALTDALSSQHTWRGRAGSDRLE